MINKEFVPYKEALELKEIGFDESCLAFYDGKNDPKIYFNNIRNGTGEYLPFTKHDRLSWFGAPTFSQAFRFFRDKYKLHYSIDYECSQHDHKWGYNWSIYNYNLVVKTDDDYITSAPDAPSGEWVYDSHEEAELACLRKLIEIVKS